MPFDFTDAICLAALAATASLALPRAKLALGLPASIPKPLALLGSLALPLLLVAALRVAVAEPFRIPSASMNPLLADGDFILVDKSSWGIKAPWTHSALAGAAAPARGDVAVFRFPKDPSVDFVKRLVGLPGDLVEYRRKQLWINGEPASYGPAVAEGGSLTMDERLPGEAKAHRIAISGRLAPPFPAALLDGCSRGPDPDSLSCRVPAGSYFAMGDNRDDSLDSRYWGWVPSDLLVGRPFFIWMSFGGLGRMGPLR